MRVLIATTYVPFGPPGLDLAAERLVQEMRNLDHDVDVVRVPFRTGCETLIDRMLGLRCLDVTESGGNRIDRLVALGFPAYVIPHPAKAVWLTSYSPEGCAPWADTCDQTSDHTSKSFSGTRAQVSQSDRLFLGESRRVVVATRSLAECLHQRVGLIADVAYLPPTRLATPPADIKQGDYLVCPIDALSTTRQRLVHEAMTRATGSYLLRVVVKPRHMRDAGSWSDLGERVQVSEVEQEDELERLIRGSRGLVYVPEHESQWTTALLYALEARVPVITTTDAGAPREIIRHQETGLVVEAFAPVLADAMSGLARDATRAARLGKAAYAAMERADVTWHHAAELLTA